MAFIEYVDYEDASPELKKIYDAYGAPKKLPANIIRISSVTPKAMTAHVGLYRAVMGAASSLSARQREMVATVVSAINKCHY